MLDLLAQLPQPEFDRPPIDWAAISPELVLLGFGVLVTLLDVVMLEKGRRYTSALAGIALLAPMIPVLWLWNNLGDEGYRTVFGDAYVVDRYSLILKLLFLATGYVVVLLSTNYIAEGDYWENEYYGLLISSVLGMVMMASSRDLISVFVALELLSIPAYLLAAWRKRDPRSNEAGIKYYLMGVFASAIMLYGMSLVYGVSGSTLLTDIAGRLGDEGMDAAIALGIVFIVGGFAFKISAVPFHSWAPDTYEGAPTPVTAFLSVASKTAGFVALITVVVFAFIERHDIYQPLIWALAVLSMTIGNLMALRQTNMIRMMAYSGVAQSGFMLAPLAVAGDLSITDSAVSATLTYLVIYAAMNLGAFAVIIALARKTGSAEIEDLNGAFHYAPGLTVAMTVFLFSLAGIPPMGGFFAKFNVFKVLTEANTSWAYVLAVIVAVNSVIALYYYAAVARRMWAEEAPGGDLTPVRVPPSLVGALAITIVATLVFGIFPGTVADFTDLNLAFGG